MCADLSKPEKALLADRTEIGGWETFGLIELGDDKIALQGGERPVCMRRYRKKEKPLVANRDSIGGWETFTRINLGEARSRCGRPTSGTCVLTWASWTSTWPRTGRDRRLGNLHADRDRTD